MLRILDRARTLGIVGPGDLGVHLEQAAALAAVVGDPPERFLDLGSGAGVPGLALALGWPSSRAVLLDAASSRADFLRSAVAELDLTARVAVLEGRAEALARDPIRRGAFDLVVARGFAAPAVTAECGVGFVRAGGRVVVTDPPDPPPDRWDRPGLERLGYDSPEHHRREGFGFTVLQVRQAASDEWPRPAVAKHPLW